MRETHRNEEQSLVAVAIDKDKGSQAALKWAIENLVTTGQTILLVHVKKTSSNAAISDDAYTKEIFMPFRCFCMRKSIQCQDFTLEGTDVAKTIIEFVAQNVLEKLVVGSPAKNSFLRFRTGDTPASISKGAPDFCTVYVISKAKVSSMRKAIRQAPTVSPLMQQAENIVPVPEAQTPPLPTINDARLSRLLEEKESMRSPFVRGGRPVNKSYGELSMYENSDISFVSSGRPSTDRMFPSIYDDFDGPRPPRSSYSSDRSFEMLRTPRMSIEGADMTGNQFSSVSQDSGTSWSSQTMDDVELEMRRLKLELKQTMDMYSTACREALTAKQKADELQRWKLDEEQRLREARFAEEAAAAMVEKERAKCMAALEAAEAARRIADLEAQKRLSAERRALLEAEERNKAFNSLARNDVRYRKYTIEEIEVATEYFNPSRKIGEGGYGPVFKSTLDHTPVAIKVLRPDAAQGKSQFQQEVEVLSCIRHPNMVLLLGACPDYGCLVYEYMANGSLDDRLFCRGNTPVLSWQLRFRIAAEIATGLLFLHQTKPEPLVHRDLKPANILLDRNYVSKISDVGLARLVPPSVANNVTQYRMTSAAGTFCYIDPEYQQTGMLGIKSDVYSLGVMLLQMVTGKPPMGLTHYVADAVENGTFDKMLDPAVTDWPYEEALTFAKLALSCAELRRKDRPDLGTVVLPELNRLRDLADENMYHGILGGSTNPSPMHSYISMSSQDVMSDPLLAHSETESSRSRSSICSLTGRERRVD